MISAISDSYCTDEEGEKKTKTMKMTMTDE